MEFLFFSFELDYNDWFSIMTTFNFERPKFNILLNMSISKLSTNKSLSIKDSVFRISCCLWFSSFSNFSFFFSESNIRWCGSVTLFVFNNDNFFTFHDCYARIGGTEIDTDTWPFTFIVWHIFCCVCVLKIFKFFNFGLYDHFEINYFSRTFNFIMYLMIIYQFMRIYSY